MTAWLILGPAPILRMLISHTPHGLRTGPYVGAFGATRGCSAEKPLRQGDENGSADEGWTMQGSRACNHFRSGCLMYRLLLAGMDFAAIDDFADVEAVL